MHQHNINTNGTGTDKGINAFWKYGFTSLLIVVLSFMGLGTQPWQREDNILLLSPVMKKGKRLWNFREKQVMKELDVLGVSAP